MGLFKVTATTSPLLLLDCPNWTLEFGITSSNRSPRTSRGQWYWWWSRSAERWRSFVSGSISVACPRKTATDQILLRRMMTSTRWQYFQFWSLLLVDYEQLLGSVADGPPYGLFLDWGISHGEQAAEEEAGGVVVDEMRCQIK